MYIQVGGLNKTSTVNILRTKKDMTEMSKKLLGLRVAISEKKLNQSIFALESFPVKISSGDIL